MVAPDFSRVKNILQCKSADFPVLFEFFMNKKVYDFFTEGESFSSDKKSQWRKIILAFYRAGYDHVTIPARYITGFSFPAKTAVRKQTISQNEGAVITDRATFDTYQWQNPQQGNYHLLDEIKTDLPGNMKIIVSGPGGVLENVVQLTGFENLCYMTMLDPELALDIFDNVGKRLVEFYKICLQFETVGAIISNDDWGFKTQTMLAPSDLRKYVFPWQKKIVEHTHEAGKYAILHSCGYISSVIDDIINDMKFDAKHSFEDGILPVETAYKEWGRKIAILGGIDMDFLCRGDNNEIYRRASNLLEMTAQKGGYALGSGNSIPEFVPLEKYLAMLKPAWEARNR